MTFLGDTAIHIHSDRTVGCAAVGRYETAPLMQSAAHGYHYAL